MTSHYPPWEELLELARRAATEGARIIAQPLQTDDVTTKGRPGDIVTRLDLAAERRIRSILAEARPEDRVVGEEMDDAGAPDAALRWSIDPLDGTTNRVKGLPFYAASVAVQDTASGRWLAGAVNAPALRREYFALREGGAWARDWLGEQDAPARDERHEPESVGRRGGDERREFGGAGTRRLSGPDPDSGTRLLGTGLSYDGEARVRQLAELAQHMHHFDDMRSLGSAALGLCAVAEGSVDAFLESDLYEFDWAAGALIAEEAGATVERPEGHRGGILAYFGAEFAS